MGPDRRPELLPKWAMNIVDGARPLAAAGAIFGSQAAIARPTFADVLHRPGAAVVTAPLSDVNRQISPPSAINTEANPDRILELTRSMITKIGGMFPDAEKRVGALGYRISNSWVGQDGFKYIAFQRAIVQEAPDGSLHLWNTLDNMSSFGMDIPLDNGTYAVTVPPKQEFADKASTLNEIFIERAAILTMHPDVFIEAQNIRQVLEIGVPTGYKDYGPYEVWRFQRMALMRWKVGPDAGLIQPILVGDAAKAAGLIPKEVQLAEPDMGSGGGSPEQGPARDFAAAYRSSSGATEIQNPPTGQIGFKEAYPGGLDLIEQMAQDGGLKGVKFVPTTNIPLIREKTGLYYPCNPNLPDPRCSVDYLRELTDVVDGFLVVRYEISNPEAKFKQSELDSINWGVTLGLIIPEHVNQSPNSQKWLGWRQRMRAEKPLLLAAPILNE